MRRIVLSWTTWALVCVVCEGSAAGSTGATVNKRVKSGPGNASIVAENGHEAPATEFCNCAVTSFSGRTVNVGAAPEPPHTTIPFTTSTCFRWNSGTLLYEWPMTFNFPSLHDVGTWTITCNGRWFDPDYCSPVAAGCGLFCNPYSLSDWSNPFVWTYVVTNAPPTANITSSGTPAWNALVTLHSNGNDPDHGTTGLHYFWGISAHPPMSGVNLSSTSVRDPTIQLNSEHDIGRWTFTLSVDDQENERVTPSSYSVDVPNSPPTLSTAPGSPITIDAGHDITITATANDPDGGPAPSLSWDIVSAPAGASQAAQSNYATGNVFTPIPTRKRDIGTWNIDVHATDNEGESANPSGKVTNHITVNVMNHSPEIHLSGSHSIRVGDTIHAETSSLTDFLGEDLRFRWEVVQVPHSAGVAVSSVVAMGVGVAGASIDLPTTAIDAGTWIFKLTATETGVDSSVMPRPTVSDTFQVLVDDDPTAGIAVSAVGPLGGGNPPSISTGSFPLTLDASGSVDPDSPCPTDPNHCHDTAMGPAVVSPGIVAYLWRLIDVSPELEAHLPARTRRRDLRR